MTYEDRIRQARSDLSPSFNRLAKFLLDSYTQSAFLTATELAHILDVDPATVVRFSQRLGYRGYPELQREIRQRVMQEITVVASPNLSTAREAVDSAMSEVSRSLELTRRSFPLESAEGLVAKLDESERVVVMAEALAFAPARNLAGWLEAAGYTVHLTGTDPAEIARGVASLRTGDVVIAIEIVGETSTLAIALDEAGQAGAFTAALVAAPSSVATQHADLVLAAHASEDSNVRQMMVDALTLALVRILLLSRPGRFETAQQKVQALTARLSRE